MTHDEIRADYPELTQEDIRACLAYAAERERRVIASRCPHAMRAFACSLNHRHRAERDAALQNRTFRALNAS
jgi:hypothetical protein